MRGRTVILVSHHVQLCAPGASYIVALDNGRVQFQGSHDAFVSSGVLNTLVQSGATDPTDEKAETAVANVEEITGEKGSSDGTTEDGSTSAAPTIIVAAEPKKEKKPPRKLIEEEKRAVGRIGRDIWKYYFSACGGVLYWVAFTATFVLAMLAPVFENGWLRYVIRNIFLMQRPDGSIAYGRVQ